MNKQTKCKGQCNFTLFYFYCLYQADPVTLLPPKQSSRALFFSEQTVFLFTYGKAKYFWEKKQIYENVVFKSITRQHRAPLGLVCLLCGLRYGNIWDTTVETYVLCEEEIQYWDSGLFMSSGTTVESRGSYTEFSFEYRNVRNYKQKCNMIRL